MRQVFHVDPLIHTGQYDFPDDIFLFSEYQPTVSVKGRTAWYRLAVGSFNDTVRLKECLDLPTGGRAAGGPWVMINDPPEL